MQAAVLHETNTPLSIEQVEIEKPKRREVLLRTAFAGLCHSDLHFIEGLYPFPLPCVLGHEAAAVVEATSRRATTSSPACRCSAASARNASPGIRTCARTRK